MSRRGSSSGHDICALCVVIRASGLALGEVDAGIQRIRHAGVVLDAVRVVAAHDAARSGRLSERLAGDSGCGSVCVAARGENLHPAGAAVDGGIELVHDVVAMGAGGERGRAGEVGVCGSSTCGAGRGEVLLLCGQGGVVFLVGERHCCDFCFID
jgi:hypothetical protein